MVSIKNMKKQLLDKMVEDQDPRCGEVRGELAIDERVGFAASLADKPHPIDDGGEAGLRRAGDNAEPVAGLATTRPSRHDMARRAGELADCTVRAEGGGANHCTRRGRRWWQRRSGKGQHR